MDSDSGLIAGRYERVEVLGEGSTATVYRVRDTETGEALAVKMLSPRLARHRSVRERFAREAAVTAKLDHPNVVRVHGVGEHDDAPELAQGRPGDEGEGKGMRKGTGRGRRKTRR